MNFWDHLEVLRSALLRVAAVWVVVSVGLFCGMPRIFEHVVMAPCHDGFASYRCLRALAAMFAGYGSEVLPPFGIRLINIRLTAPLMIHISTALLLSATLCAPYLVYELWRFVRPALYSGERRPVRRALTIGTALFYVGLLVGYFIIFPITLRFLAGYTLTGDVANHISIDSYIETFNLLILCIGLCFELPVVCYLLSLMGIINKALLRRYRRHAVVAIVVLAAVITPTGDPFTLMVVSIPLYLLYELGILLMKNDERRPAGDNK